MTEKLAQTMTTLAEDSREMKTSLRLLLKYEVQHLEYPRKQSDEMDECPGRRKHPILMDFEDILERLKDLGEESIILLANANEGTSAKLGTGSGANFLSAIQTNFNADLKNMFLKFCTDANKVGSVTMTTVQHQAHPKQEGFFQQQLNLNGMGGLQSQAAKQQSMSSNRYTPYGSVGIQRVPQGPMQPELPNFWHNRSTTRVVAPKTPVSTTTNQSKRKRNICRHFVGKGHCWQGSLCSFLHTRDPNILASLGIDPESAAAADSSQVSQSDEGPEACHSQKEDEERKTPQPVYGGTVT